MAGALPIVIDSDSDDSGVAVVGTLSPGTAIGPGAGIFLGAGTHPGDGTIPSAGRLPLHPSVGLAAERRVLAALAAGGLTALPPWVQSAVALYGQSALGHTGSLGRPGSWLQCRGSSLRTMHDCRGIDGIGEALRFLYAAGIMLEPHALKAASERAAGPRMWCQMFHAWPEEDFVDMCSRGPTPACDLYCNGFPCQPFSTRRGDQSHTFDEENARPCYAMLEEVRSGKHKAILLENVQGLLRKRYHGEKCIDVLIKQLRDAAAGRYFLHLHCDVSPHVFGEPVHRPRIFIRMVRADQCLVSSEEEFQTALKASDKLLAESTRRITGGSISAVTCLERRGFLDSHKVQTTGPVWCPCCLPVVHGGPVRPCHLHKCCCSECANKSGTACSWVTRHAEGWQRLAARSTPSTSSGDPDLLVNAPERSYFVEAHRRGLPASGVASTPRVRNLLELVASELWVQGVDPFLTDAVLDISQSYGRHALRVDGLLPTVATTSRIYVMRLGVVLQPAALLSVMGFPVSVYQADMDSFDDNTLRRMVGNTMHPGAAGPMLVGLLGLLKHPDVTMSDDD